MRKSSKAEEIRLRYPLSWFEMTMFGVAFIYTQEQYILNDISTIGRKCLKDRVQDLPPPQSLNENRIQKYLG